LSGVRRPYTLSPIMATGARPHAPTQRSVSMENLPSGVTPPSGMLSWR
jgi:hypothetical protein